MQFISTEDKVIFEVQAEEEKTRDQWVLCINELLQDWSSNPDKKPKDTRSAGGTSNKDQYFKQRQQELEAREKASAEKRTKYATGGMKFTAQVMASRA